MTQVIKLLLVQDSVRDGGMLRAALLEASGANVEFELIQVFRLADALQQSQGSTFDLVLLDLSLPDGQGIDNVVRMRSANMAVPIIILTGLDDEALAIEAMRLGVQDFLVKGQAEGSTLVRAIRCAIERKRVDAHLQEQRARQAVLHGVNLAMTSTLDLQSVLDAFLDSVTQQLPEFAITVRLFNHETGILEPLACRSVDEAAWKRMLPGEMRTGRASAALAARRPLAITDALSDPRTTQHEFMRHNRLVSYVGVPLFVKGESLGVVAFYTRARREFAPEEIDFFATLAGQAAMAIHNSQLYERLKQTNENLAKTLEVKGALVGVIAHELKTPLQVIVGASGLLSSGMCGELTADQAQRVAAIERGTDELMQLIDSTLTMARLEQEGKTSLMISEVCVNSLLSELKADFLEVFQKKGLEFNVQIPPPGFTIQTDHFKLKGILRNLVGNARKFTSQGKVEVTFARRDGDRRIEFTVSDTGIGIEKKVLPRIFDLFYQADPTLVVEQASAGLGLNIVKRLVAAMSGEINVLSELGKGSTFRVDFPRNMTAKPID